MEGCRASPDPLRFRGFPANHSRLPAAYQCLNDFHANGNVEFPAGGHQLVNIFERSHPVFRRAMAGSQKPVIEVFADHGIVSSADLENIVSAGNFGIAE